MIDPTLNVSLYYNAKRKIKKKEKENRKENDKIANEKM